MPPKPTIYLDTSFISSFWYEGSDFRSSIRRVTTREWWDLEREYFDLRLSIVTIGELQSGAFRRQSSAVEMAKKIRRLSTTRTVREFALELVESGIVPESKPNDAAHMAYAAVHNIDYLLTWNHAHMANVEAQRCLDKVCYKARIRPPNMVSPETIPRVTFGEEIRRKDHGDIG